MGSDINKKKLEYIRKCKSLFDFVNTRISKDAWFKWFVVLGLNNFQVGFPTVLPTEGSAVDPSSYDVCGSVTLPADVVSIVIDVECTASTHQYRYVIVQSLDASAEKLCIAEACVNVASQY